MKRQSGRPPRAVARWVLDVEARAVAGLLPQLDEGFDRSVELLSATRGRVVTTGMGKSGLVMRKVAATLSSTVDGGAPPSTALKLMEEHRITSLFVCDDAGRLEGVVHLHDLWRLELF